MSRPVTPDQTNSLFGTSDNRPGLVRRDAPATSRAAAAAVKPITGRARQRVYAAIRTSGGLTDEEIGDRLDMNLSTVRPRRVELVESGHVRDSKLRRETRSGRSAIVWVALSVRQTDG